MLLGWPQTHRKIVYPRVLATGCFGRAAIRTGLPLLATIRAEQRRFFFAAGVDSEAGLRERREFGRLSPVVVKI